METHGTGSEQLPQRLFQVCSVVRFKTDGILAGVGDPIEVRSIRDAFGGPQRDFVLHFESAKGNIGHTGATAGIVGLIKVLLMMRHGRLRPKRVTNR